MTVRIKKKMKYCYYAGNQNSLDSSIMAMSTVCSENLLNLGSYLIP